jgi:hypothetical protein
MHHYQTHPSTYQPVEFTSERVSSNAWNTNPPTLPPHMTRAYQELDSDSPHMARKIRSQKHGYIPRCIHTRARCRHTLSRWGKTCSKHTCTHQVLPCVTHTPASTLHLLLKPCIQPLDRVPARHASRCRHTHKHLALDGLLQANGATKSHGNSEYLLLVLVSAATQSADALSRCRLPSDRSAGRNLWMSGCVECK